MQFTLHTKVRKFLLHGRAYEYDECASWPIFYLVTEEVNIPGMPRKGLSKLLFGELGKPKKKLRVLVQLKRNWFDGGSATILDASLRDSTERIMKELDEKSGESYSSQTSYSTENNLTEFEEVIQ